MSIKTRDELKQIFVTAAKPTEINFHDWLDSVRMTTEPIPVDQVSNIFTNNGTVIFYVEKLYTGSPAVYFTDTSGIVVSANSSYNNQLAKAKPGNPSLPYPDPYSARNAANAAIGAGNITNAIIQVKDNQRWTVGSNDQTLNGSLAGSATTNTVADLQFSATGATAIASLFSTTVRVVFGYNSGFDYINSKYTIYLGYWSAPTSTTTSDLAITGKGAFKQIYGEAQGFSASLIYVDDPNANVFQSYEQLTLNQWGGILFINVAREICEINTILSYESNTFGIKSKNAPMSGLPQQHSIKVNNVQWANSLNIGLSAPKDDDWYFLYTQDCILPTQIDIHIGNCYQVATGDYPLYSTGGIQPNINGMRVNVTVDNYYMKLAAGKTVTRGLIATGGGNNSSNMQSTFTIKNLYAETGLVYYYGNIYGTATNCHFLVDVKNGVLNLPSTVYGVTRVNNYSYPGTNSDLTITGNITLTNGATFYGDHSNAFQNANTALVIFKDLNLNVTSATSYAFVRNNALSKDLLLENVTINCADGMAFYAAAGTPLPILIKNVSTTDANVASANIQYDGEAVKVLPRAYFK